MESYHLGAARCLKLWSLNVNLLFKEPHQLTKLAEIISLQRFNCNIIGFTDTVVIR